MVQVQKKDLIQYSKYKNMIQQLNNNNTAQVVKILSITDSGIAYTTYETPFIETLTGSTYFQVNGIPQTIDKNVIVPLPTASIKENEQYLANQILIGILPEFALSNDTQNWKDTMLDKPIRISIPNLLVLDALACTDTEDPKYMLGQLISALMEQLKERLLRTKHYLMVYIISYDSPEQEQLLRMFSDIIIENKL